MNQEQKKVYYKEYLPYIIKWGKITCWLSIPLIFIPSVVLFFVYGYIPNLEGFITGFITLASAMFAWYIVDPVTLYPILHIPGMYMTYIAGNSKEIRAPAATSALSATDVEAGTEHGTVISCIAIATSIFISLAVMTLVAIAGNLILSILPSQVVHALNYLLPALFGAMCVQRVMLDFKTSIIVLPCAVVLRLLAMNGVFSILPFGGGYASLLFCVIIGVFAARMMNMHKLK